MTDDLNKTIGVEANKSLNTVIDVPVVDEIIQDTEVSLDSAYATGRRKESVVKFWIFIDRTEKFSVDSIAKKFDKIFNNLALSYKAVKPIILLNEVQNFSFNFKFKIILLGGGKSGQADALKLAFAKALSLLFPDMRPILRKNGCLTSDGRRKEREHPGFRTSRKPQQYSRR